MNSKQNDLFRGGSEFHLNACVGDNGGPYDYSHFAQGYFIAAERLLDSLAEAQSNLDFLIYPIAHTLRHAIELSLKHLGQVLPRLFGDSAPTRFTHRLSDLWHNVRPYLLRDEQFDPDSNLIAKMDAIIRSFMEIDPNGEVFRYPLTKAGDNPLTGYGLFNALVIQQAMQTSREAFDWWSFSAGYLGDGICYSSAYC